MSNPNWADDVASAFYADYSRKVNEYLQQQADAAGMTVMELAKLYYMVEPQPVLIYDDDGVLTMSGTLQLKRRTPDTEEDR